MILRRIARACLLAALALASWKPAADAAFTQYDTATYDWATLGVPKFVDVNYIDLRKITQISKFRSAVGHEFSDGSQFNTESYFFPTGLERCRSMKHYFIAPDAGVKIYAPTSGVISRRFDEAIGGTQLQITSDVQPAFTFYIFHVELTVDLPVGTLVTAGQELGHHVGTQTYSDIAVAVHTPRGYHHVSYFETLTDAAFAQFQARGITTREQMIYTREERDAARFSCAGSAFTNPLQPAATDFVALTGGALTQTITTSLPQQSYVYTVGDTPQAITATASSALPVTLSSTAPKVCAVSGAPEAGATVSFRRPGICRLTLSQSGNDDTQAAPSIEYTASVYAPGNVPPFDARLGGVFPPSSTGTQSLLRVLNTGGTPGTITVALYDGASGNTVATWTSPAIPARTSQQFSIADLETAATANFSRPATYGLRVTGTTLYGTFQHVLFNLSNGALTNASSCSGGRGVYGNPVDFVGVHGPRLAMAYPSTTVFTNATGTPGIFPNLTLRSAAGGATITIDSPEAPNHASIAPHAQASSLATELGTGAGATIDALHFALNSGNYRFPSAYTAHLVDNAGAGLIADMTAHCSMNGFADNTVLTPVVAGNVFSASNAASQSYLRFYNGGTTAAPVTVTLHEVDYGKALTSWTSPSVPPNGELQIPLARIEAETGVTTHPQYTVSVDASFDGAFQHVLMRGTGPLSNASSCAGGAAADGTTAIAVHASGLANAGYPSTVIVNNASGETATAQVGVFDANTGGRLGGFAVSIPANAQRQYTSAALETAAQVSPGGTLHYVVKLEDGFNGFLQHYVSSNGVVTDMTLMCGM